MGFYESSCLVEEDLSRRSFPAEPETPLKNRVVGSERFSFDRARFSTSQPLGSHQEITITLTIFVSDRQSFWSMDAWEGSRREPASLHRYIYASDNPLAFVDPSGLQSLSEIVMVASIIGDLAKLTQPFTPNFVVELRTTPLTLLPYPGAPVHSYIFVQFGGHQYTISAGPNSDYPTGGLAGYLLRPGASAFNIPVPDIYLQADSYRWEQSPEKDNAITSIQVLIDKRMPGHTGMEVWARLISFGGKVNLLMIPYRPQTANCNAFTCSAVRQVLGLVPIAQPGMYGCDWTLAP